MFSLIIGVIIVLFTILMFWQWDKAGKTKFAGELLLLGISSVFVYFLTTNSALNSVIDSASDSIFLVAILLLLGLVLAHEWWHKRLKGVLSYLIAMFFMIIVGILVRTDYEALNSLISISILRLTINHSDFRE
jgi:hypothetical protein